MHSIVLIGNCQIRALYNLYNRFVAGAARQPMRFIASYEGITEADRAAIEAADILVEQVLDFKPKADIAGIATSAERVLVPMVNCGFLWPFAGQPHPNNPSRSYLETGPYGAEMSDAWLNRMIKTGVDPETAVERYMQLDVNATVNLDRLYEIGIEKQRKRDELTGFKIAELIVEHFRHEAVFRTPYHPNERIAVALASQFFERLAVSSGDIDRLRRAIRITPFPKDELPIHPAVVRHFGLGFVPEDRRWRFLNEGTFPIRELYLRYMGCVWNEPLAEGLERAQTSEFAEARKSLEEGLAVSPDAAAGHGTLALVFSRLGRREDAIAAVKRATALDPGHAPHHAMLGVLLRTAGEFEAAEQELRVAVELDPFDPHFPAHLANFLRERDRLAEALAVLRQGIAESPYAANLYVELGHVLARTGDKAGAEEAFRGAREFDPTNIAPVFGLAEILEQRGDAVGAVALLEQVLEHQHDNPRLLQRLARALDLANRRSDAVVALEHALAVERSDPQLHRDLIRLLLHSDNVEEAEAAA